MFKSFLRTKAKPVFLMFDRETWNMDIDQVEKKITKKLNNSCCTYLWITYVYAKTHKNSQKYNLKVIEDASEVIGLIINNRMCGYFWSLLIF